MEEQHAFLLTEKGNGALRAPGTSLALTELQILILVDGGAWGEQLTKNAVGLDAETALQTVQSLLESGHITTDRSKGIRAGETGTASSGQSHYSATIARRAAVKRKLSANEKLHVLMVEDDPDLANLLCTYFEFQGFVPRVAANREQIVSEIRRAPLPDLVMLDVTLPDVDGFDVLARIREHPALRSLPVILLTAHATREEVLRGLLCGANGYITKPFHVNDIVQAANAVLGLV